MLVGALPQSPQNTKLMFWNAGFVLADCVSFASPQTARLSHFIARPLPTKPWLCGGPFLRLRDFANRLWAGSSTLLRLFFPSFIRFLLLLVQLQNTVDIGLGRQQLFHFLAGFSVVGVGRFLLRQQLGVLGIQCLDGGQLLEAQSIKIVLCGLNASKLSGFCISASSMAAQIRSRWEGFFLSPSHLL